MSKLKQWCNRNSDTLKKSCYVVGGFLIGYGLCSIDRKMDLLRIDAGLNACHDRGFIDFLDGNGNSISTKEWINLDKTI